MRPRSPASAAFWWVAVVSLLASVALPDLVFSQEVNALEVTYAANIGAGPTDKIPSVSEFSSGSPKRDPQEEALSRGSPEAYFGLYPWIGVSRWTRPRDVPAEKTGGHMRTLFGELELDSLRIRFDERPQYLPPPEYRPILDSRPRAPSRRHQALVDIVEEETYRQIRRVLKRNWKDVLESSPSMTYEFYQSRLTVINQVGKDPDDYDLFNADYLSNQARNDVLGRKGLEGEKELILVEWGPLKVDDRGSVSFDVWSLLGLESSGEEAGFRKGPRAPRGKKRNNSPLFSGKIYRIDTRFKLNFDPLRSFRSGEPLETVRSYGGVVEVDFLSDILNREMFSTEFEVEADREGQVAFFFNIVLRARR